MDLKSARSKFEEFEKKWHKYLGAINVWRSNFKYVEQLFDFGSDVRRIMYTTNAIESVNHSFRKVTNKGAFPHKEAVYKLLYLRVKELEDKWDGRPVKNWSLVLNQLLTDERFEARIKNYLDH